MGSFFAVLCMQHIADVVLSFSQAARLVSLLRNDIPSDCSRKVSKQACLLMVLQLHSTS